MDKFELHMHKDESGGMQIKINGSEEDSVCCLAYLINAVEYITKVNKEVLVSAALAMLDTVPIKSEKSIVCSEMVEDAYRRLKRRKT